MLASIVIRTLNEAKHLEDLLKAIAQQDTKCVQWEVIIVDSGSTDGTLDIAARYPSRVLHITRQQFSFGRSLNMGCEAAQGDALVMISGHCVPTNPLWLENLCKPIMDGTAEYTYGGQLGGEESYYSEKRIFAKYFPEQSSVPQDGFYCNNANSAVAKSTWEKYRFDEEITGLEDMHLAKRLVADGGKLAYVAPASVFHYHQETWAQVRRRFEREAIALQYIMPQVHIRRRDMLRYVVTSIIKDWNKARQHGVFLSKFFEIIRYRTNQYVGSYKGNHDHRKLSHGQKEEYFYPN
ncbi:MAG: glycosyltransferase [Arenimonas sp.]